MRAYGRKAGRGVLRVLGVVLVVEVAAYLTTAVANLLLWDPIRPRHALLGGQAEGMERVLTADSLGATQLDPLLGWRLRAGYSAGLDTINAAGMRSSRDYELRPAPGRLRIAAFGDSFVYCYEVAHPECWTAILETEWSVEVLNYGVGGYGTDQAFLRYLREGARYGPQHVVIGFAPVNLQRAVSRYRPFFSERESPLFKPRFELVEDRLRLIEPFVGTRPAMRALLADPERVIGSAEGDYWYDAAEYE